MAYSQMGTIPLGEEGGGGRLRTRSTDAFRGYMGTVQVFDYRAIQPQ